MKWRPAPGTTLDEANAWAKETFGPLARAHYEKQFKPAHRCTISIRFKDEPAGLWRFGVVGTGKDWVTARADAETRWAEYQAKQAAEATEETL